MHLATRNCPTPDVLENFLLGRLEPTLQSRCESHVSDCPSCHDTLRGLDAEDTFSAYVSKAFEQEESIDEGVANAAVRRLIDRLTVPGNLEIGERQLAADELSSTRSKIPRAELELMADRAAEVLRCLSPEDSAMGKLGHYELIRLIGAGSSGVVFQANDTSLNRLVAVKVLRPSLGPIARERFLAEAKAAAAIEHANVVTIFHVGEQDRLAYLVMQWLPGQTLDALLQRDSVLSEAKVRDIATEVAKGLSAAHQKQMIHRDIKPANIWLADDGSIKLLDFGLARIADDDSGLTATGMLAGTPNYMSPEQTKGLELDGRSDLFSLGCLMYRLLTGRLPFGGSTVLATLQSIQHHYPISVQAVRLDASDDLTDITMSLLEKQPANRPESAQQVIQLLQTERQAWPRSINRYEGLIESCDGDSNLSGERPAPSLKSMSRTRSWVLGLAWTVGLLMLAAAGYWMGPQIIRIATDQGELVIETEDEAIEIEILQNGKLIKLVDVETKSSLDIRSGEYQLRARPKGDAVVSFEVSPKVLKMSRGGKQLVKVTELAKKATDGVAIGGASEVGNTADSIGRMNSLLQFALAEFKQGQQSAATDELREAIRIEQQKFTIKQELESSRQRYGSRHPKIQELTAALQTIQLKQDQLLGRYQLLSTRQSGQSQSHSNPIQVAQMNQSKNGATTGQTKGPTYNGYGFDHWLNIAKNDRHPETFSGAMSACAELAETEQQFEALLPILKKTVSDQPLGVVGATVETDLLLTGCLKVARRLPKTMIAEFVVEAYRTGDANQQVFARWLIPSVRLNFGELPILSDAELTKLAEVYVGQLVPMIDIALEAKEEIQAREILSFAVPFATFTPTDELTQLNPTLKAELKLRQAKIQNHRSDEIVATLLPLMTRLGLDVDPMMDRLDRVLCKDKQGHALAAHRYIFVSLGHVQNTDWPNAQSVKLATQTEASGALTGRRIAQAKQRVEIILRELEKLCNTQSQSEAGLPGSADRWVRPMLNAIYQNASYGDWLNADDKQRNDLLAKLRGIRGSDYIKTLSNSGGLGGDDFVVDLVDSMIEAVEGNDMDNFSSNKADAFGYRQSRTGIEMGHGARWMGMGAGAFGFGKGDGGVF